ncbi:MAG: dihydroorotate dehydrogenase electron transfer subunit [Phascolarctobacterium sp.]|nr:dihydroorotate dehydrogenase electron transfer subunit [Phascolarctobacterium sp.]
MAKTIATAKVVGQKVLNSTIKILEVYAPEIANQAVPGQFVNVQVCKHTAPLLRRPFGVAGVNKEAGTFTIIYRIIGEATHILADACSGDELSIVGPLGKGFDMTAKKPLLVGGGLGLAPMKFLAEGFGAGKTDILMGGRTKEEVCWTCIYDELSEKVFVTTDDGTEGTQGTVMALLPELLASGVYDCVYVCGPVPMMKAVANACLEANVKCQVSLEKYMACGLGACLSCACGGIGKRMKVCTDGPVFWAEEVVEW